MPRIIPCLLALAVALDLSGCGRRGAAPRIVGEPPLRRTACPNPYLRDPKNPCAPNYLAPLRKRHWANSL